MFIINIRNIFDIAYNNNMLTFSFMSYIVNILIIIV